MRADSRTGRIMGALGRKAPSITVTRPRGIPRNSAVGRVVGALARDSAPYDMLIFTAPRANLRHIALTGKDLPGADLTRTDLANADLAGANLHGADLAEAELMGADLTGADLSRANLTGADLHAARLAGADLTGANLSQTDLSGTDLTGANLTAARLSNAEIIFSTKLSAVIWSGATTWPDSIADNIHEKSDRIGVGFYRVRSDTEPDQPKRSYA